jgi:signal transduction histidine kinase
MFPLKGRLSSATVSVVFGVSVAILLGLAYAAQRGTEEYARSEGWVSHTREVEAQLALLRRDLSVVSNARYEMASDPAAKGKYDHAYSQIQSRLDSLTALTADNPDQTRRLRELRELSAQRLRLIDKNTPDTSPFTTAEKKASVAQEIELGQALRNTLDAMQANEETLLGQRKLLSAVNFLELRKMLTVALAAVMLVLVVSFYLLQEQLRQRTSAERAVRRLGARILQLQDEERRRLARDLHDGLGQTLVALELELKLLRRQMSGELKPGDEMERLNLAIDLAANGLNTTRTMSYLLHPPMLEQFGLAYSVKWYVEGFTKRTGIPCDLRFEDFPEKISETSQLVLFRVVQESLTNVHRHSGSSRAEIVLAGRGGSAVALVRDFGHGMPEELRRRIAETFVGAGVGLGGMRERVNELGGDFKIESGPGGTAILAEVPVVSLDSAETGEPRGSVSNPVAAEQQSQDKQGPSDPITFANAWETV